jgi:hypothetical protein
VRSTCYPHRDASPRRAARYDERRPTTALDGYRLSNDSKHVNFIGTDNHVYELYITAGAGWVDNDLTALT